MNTIEIQTVFWSFESSNFAIVIEPKTRDTRGSTSPQIIKCPILGISANWIETILINM